MSDGGISFVMAFGLDSAQLTWPVWVKPGLKTKLEEIHHDLRDSLWRAWRHSPMDWHWNAGKKQPMPERPEFPEDITEMVKAIAVNEAPFPGWNLIDTGEAVYAIHGYNESIDWVWNHHMGFRDEETDKAAPSDKKKRTKLGYTEKLTPERFGKGLRDLMKKHPISTAAYTEKLWKDEIEKLLNFLTKGELPDGVSMEKNLPRLRLAQAANVIWYLQEVAGIISASEIAICDDCGSVIDAAGETHDWCSKCGKMRCENCSTAPYHCTCDYPCGKHCKCKPE